MAKNFRTIITFIIIIIFLIGVFFYVKACDSNIIDSINTTISDYKSGNERLLIEHRNLREQLDVYKATIDKLEQQNIALAKNLERLTNANKELGLLITRGISITGELSTDNSELRRTIDESILIIRELRENYPGE